MIFFFGSQNNRRCHGCPRSLGTKTVHDVLALNSYHLGKGKRDISLFDDIAGLLKTPPGHILFIDDDPGNVERAKQKGWQAILYVDFESFHSEMNKLLRI